MPKQPETVRVWPSPDLPPTDYLPGIGAEGAELPAEEARSLVERGLATTTRVIHVHVDGQALFRQMDAERATTPPAPPAAPEE